MNIWNKLNRPIIGLAPMDGITDFIFREVQSKIANPSVIYTEFVSAEGFATVPEKFKKQLMFTKNQHPIVVQLFGKDPEAFEESIESVCKLGFDGIDINLGCPAKNIVGNGGGVALIGEDELVRKIVYSAHKVTSKLSIPLSVKTRIIDNEAESIRWFTFLSTLPIDCIAIHGRTRKQGHFGPVNWDLIKKAADIFKKKKIVVLGNGGVRSISESNDVVSKYGLDGVLIGQAAIGNPWLFKENYTPSITDRIEAIRFSLEIIKKYKLEYRYPYGKLSTYLKGIEDSKTLRSKISTAKNIEQVNKLLNEFAKNDC